MGPPVWIFPCFQLSHLFGNFPCLGWWSCQTPYTFLASSCCSGFPVRAAHLVRVWVTAGRALQGVSACQADCIKHGSPLLFFLLWDNRGPAYSSQPMATCRAGGTRTPCLRVKALVNFACCWGVAGGDIAIDYILCVSSRTNDLFASFSRDGLHVVITLSFFS